MNRETKKIIVNMASSLLIFGGLNLVAMGILDLIDSGGKLDASSKYNLDCEDVSFSYSISRCVNHEVICYKYVGRGGISCFKR